MVMVTLAEAGVKPSRISCEGCTLHVAGVDKPEQAKETDPENPRPGPGVTRSVVVPAVEAEAVTFPGLTAIWKSGLPIKSLRGSEVEAVKLASPAKTAVSLCTPPPNMLVVKVAMRLPVVEKASGAEPRTVVPSRNVTVAVGELGCVPNLLENEAMRAICPPKTPVVLLVRLRAVDALATVKVDGVDEVEV